MRFPEVKEIKEISLQELHKVIFKTFEKKDFQILYKEIDKELLIQEEILIDDIKHLFDFKVDESVYYFPYADERKTFNHSFLGYRITPSKSFFWWIEPTVKERMFGLVDVEFSISKVSVKANDERFENVQRVYRETKSFYYDFEQEKYIQVNKKAVNDETNEYRHREQLYSAVLERLESENLSYLGRLEKYVHYFLKKEPDRVVVFQEFFKYFLQFIHYELGFLEFKLLLGHIDADNYYRLKRFISSLGREIDVWVNQLKEIENKGHFDSFKEVHMHQYRAVFEGMNRTVEKIRSIFKERDFQEIRKSKSVTMDGFYDYDQKRLYPNLVYIELDRAFKNVGGGVEYRKKEEQELLESLVKDIKITKKEQSNELLSAEEKSHLEKLNGSERMTYLNDLLNRKVLQKIITSSEKVMYLNKYR